MGSSCIILHFYQSFASLSSQGKYIYCTKVLSQYWSDQFSCIDCLLRAWLYQGQSILTETASCVLHDAHTIAQNTIARCTLLHGILYTTYYCMAWILLHDAHTIAYHMAHYCMYTHYCMAHTVMHLTARHSWCCITLLCQTEPTFAQLHTGKIAQLYNCPMHYVIKMSSHYSSSPTNMWYKAVPSRKFLFCRRLFPTQPISGV